MRCLALTCLLGAAVLLHSTRAIAESPDDLLIVCNLAVAEKVLSVEDVRDIFLRKRTSWENGMKVVPVHSPAGTPARDALRERVLKMRLDEETRYWQMRKIQGGQAEPTAFNNMLKAVYSLKGAVGYVMRKDYRKGVAKIVLVVPVQP